MYGFSIVVNGKRNSGDIGYNNINCYNRMNSKFDKDKIFEETEKYILILDGVIINKSTLLSKYEQGKWLDTLIRMYKDNGESFFSELRGSFSGALYDKASQKWIIFSDQLGSKFTYYAHIDDFFCVTEEMGQIYDILAQNNIKYKLSVEGAYLLLTFGFMVEDKTLCEEVKKIQPGHYLVFENNRLSEKVYYTLDNVADYSITEQDSIEIVDHGFREAVTKEFEKDVEYGYKHLVALSAGLDSRMTAFVAHECGFVDQINFTFSQTNYWDETIPKKIAEDLKHEWIFKSLDNGIWLLNADEVTKTMGGNVMYIGSAHSNSMFELMNFQKVGLIHTGQISGALNGAHVVNPIDRDKPFDARQAANSLRLYDKVKDRIHCDFNQELGWYYYRCLNGTNNGSQISFNYTETLSPFMDIDFLSEIMQIPIEYRIAHNLYKKWILAKYPQAASYVWEAIGATISTPTVHVKNKNIPINKLPDRLLNRLKSVVGIKDNDKLGMNPINYYYYHNSKIRDYINSYKDYLDLVEDSSLRHDVSVLFDNGTVRERIQAVSLLSALKLFYS